MESRTLQRDSLISQIIEQVKAVFADSWRQQEATLEQKFNEKMITHQEALDTVRSELQHLHRISRKQSRIQRPQLIVPTKMQDLLDTQQHIIARAIDSERKLNDHEEFIQGVYQKFLFQSIALSLPLTTFIYLRANSRLGVVLFYTFLGGCALLLWKELKDRNKLRKEEDDSRTYQSEINEFVKPLIRKRHKPRAVQRKSSPRKTTRKTMRQHSFLPNSSVAARPKVVSHISSEEPTNPYDEYTYSKQGKSIRTQSQNQKVQDESFRTDSVETKTEELQNYKLKHQVQMAEILLKRVKGKLRKMLSEEMINGFALNATEMKIVVEAAKGKESEVHKTLKTAMELLKDEQLNNFTIDDLIKIRENCELVELKAECMPSVVLSKGESRAHQSLGILLKDSKEDLTLVTTTSHGLNMQSFEFTTHFYKKVHKSNTDFVLGDADFVLGDEFYTNYKLPLPIQTEETFQDITFLKLNTDAVKRFSDNHATRNDDDLIITSIHGGDNLSSLMGLKVQKVGSYTKLTLGIIESAGETKTFFQKGEKVIVEDCILTKVDGTEPCPSQVSEAEKALSKALTVNLCNEEKDEDDDGNYFTKRGDSGSVVTTRPNADNNVQAISTHAYSFKEGNVKYSVSIPLQRAVDEMNKSMEKNATIYPTKITKPTEICFGIPFHHEIREEVKEKTENAIESGGAEG